MNEDDALGLPEQPGLHREVCNHSRYVVMDRVFFFTIDPRILHRNKLTAQTYMTDQNFDVWLTLFFLQKKQKQERGREKVTILSDPLILFIAQYM